MNITKLSKLISNLQFEPKTFLVSVNMNITSLSKLMSKLQFEPKTFVLLVNMNIIDRDIFHMIFLI